MKGPIYIRLDETSLKKVLFSRDGSAAAAVVLCGFLVFMIIPLFSVLTEKVLIKSSVHRISEVADAAVMASVFNISVEEFSEKELVFNSVSNLEEMVMEYIAMNEPKVRIEEFSMKIHDSGELCSAGSTSPYDFVHLMMKVTMERQGGKGSFEFYIHRDLEFPYGR